MVERWEEGEQAKEATTTGQVPSDDSTRTPTDMTLIGRTGIERCNTNDEQSTTTRTTTTRRTTTNSSVAFNH